jgi:transglutaminase-like putative cysteine protease
MLMLVRPATDDPHQQIQHESRWTEPHEIGVREYVDLYGNHCWRLTAPGGALRVRYDALVDVRDEPDPVLADAPLSPVDELPDDTLVYTLPSRAVQSDLLLDSAWQLFGHTPPTWERIQAVVDWVHSNVRYETGSSTATVTAVDATLRSCRWDCAGRSISRPATYSAICPISASSRQTCRWISTPGSRRT